MFYWPLFEGNFTVYYIVQGTCFARVMFMFSFLHWSWKKLVKPTNRTTVGSFFLVKYFQCFIDFKIFLEKAIKLPINLRSLSLLSLFFCVLCSFRKKLFVFAFDGFSCFSHFSEFQIIAERFSDNSNILKN
jgi:hypothetical protein